MDKIKELESKIQDIEDKRFTEVQNLKREINRLKALVAESVVGKYFKHYDKHRSTLDQAISYRKVTSLREDEPTVVNMVMLNVIQDGKHGYFYCQNSTCLFNLLGEEISGDVFDEEMEKFKRSIENNT